TENVRLRCRAHNQYGAEQSFGAGFMQRKREEAIARRVAMRAAAAREASRRAAEAAKRASEKAAAQELLPWLRALGYNQAEAWNRAQRASIQGGTLEEQIRRALSLTRG